MAERETNSEIQRRTETDRYTDRADRHNETDGDRQSVTYRTRDRQRQRQTETNRYRQTDTETDRYRDRHMQTQRQRHVEREERTGQIDRYTRIVRVVVDMEREMMLKS